MITLEQARQKLPEGYEITDEELSGVIADCYTLADLAIDEYLSEKGEFMQRMDC